jgi:hypothetical protein
MTATETTTDIQTRFANFHAAERRQRLAENVVMAIKSKALTTTLALDMVSTYDGFRGSGVPQQIV